MRWFIVPAVIFFATLGHAAPQSPGAAAFEYGYFCALDPVAIEEAQGTVSGVIMLVDTLPPFIARGPQVPARIGVGFGVHVQVLPQFEGPASIHIQHPPMGPNGVTDESWTTSFSAAEKQYAGFSFEEDYEVLPGIWTMSAYANGRPIYSVTFEVVDPLIMPDVTCGEQVPLS